MSTRIAVTHYTHPDCDESLTLRGTESESRPQALQYFIASPEKLRVKEDTMDENEFLDLPEFQS